MAHPIHITIQIAHREIAHREISEPFKISKYEYTTVIYMSCQDSADVNANYWRAAVTSSMT